MKVAIVYHFFATYRKPILEHLHVNENDSYVFVGDPVNRMMPGVPVWQPEPNVDFLPARGFVLPGGFLLQRNVVGLALDSEIDAIIYLGDWHFITTWVSALLARLTGKKVIFWTHGWRPSSGILKSVLRKLFYPLANALILYGNVARKIGVEQGFNDKRMYVIYNSLDHENQKLIRESVTESDTDGLRRELFDAPDDPILVLVGRLKKSKRVDLLFKAASQLRKSRTPVNVLIVGDGDDATNLKQLANSLKIPTHFYGTCHDDEIVGRLLMCADLTVCPRAAGLSVIHSLMFGVPVVTSDNMTIQGPEVEAIVHGISGQFFADGDVDSLTQTIQQMLNRDLKQMRQHCHAIVDRFYNPTFQAAEIRRAVRLEAPTRTNVEQAIVPVTHPASEDVS